jgi:hypothetical protein
VGEIVVAEQVADHLPETEPPEPAGGRSPTRTGWSYGTDEGQRFRGIFYRGIARHLTDGRWLLGDTELVTPSAALRVVLTKVERLPEYRLIMDASAHESHILGQIADLYHSLGDQTIGGERSIIDQHFAAAAADRLNGMLLLAPAPVIYALQAGAVVPGYLLPLVDVQQRIMTLGMALDDHSPLQIDEADWVRTDPDERSDVPEAADAERSIASELAAGKLTWNKPHTPIETLRSLLIGWFVGQGGLSPTELTATIAALGGSAVPRLATPPTVVLALPDDADVSARLRNWVPQPLHNSATAVAAAASAADKAIANGQPADGEAPHGFTLANFAELVDHLDDQRPSAWREGDVIHPIADCALFGMAEVLDFDPRHLVSIPVNAPWTDQRRSEAAASLRRWWQQARDHSLPDAVAKTAALLPAEQGIRLLMRVPNAWKSTVLQELMQNWAVQPPDLSHLSPRRASRLLALLAAQPGGRALAAQWNLDQLPPLLVALWRSGSGDSSPIDVLLEAALNQRPGDPPRFPADPFLIRKLIVAVSAAPLPQRIAQLTATLRRPTDDPVMQQVLMAAIFRSSWTQGLDALLPGAAINRHSQEPKWHYGNPTALSWALWSIAIDDQRPLPAGIRTALSTTDDGYFHIKHQGANASAELHMTAPDFNDHASVTPLIDQPKAPQSTELAADLRICDLVAWALMRQEHSYLYSGDPQTPWPIVDLTLPKNQREKAVAQVGHAVRLHTFPLLMRPVADDASTASERR